MGEDVPIPVRIVTTDLRCVAGGGWIITTQELCHFCGWKEQIHNELAVSLEWS